MSLAHQIQPNGIAAKAIAIRDGGNSLPAMVSRAAQQLASATTAAEVLDARDFASVAYDAAKKAARFAKAKGAADEVIAKAHRAQADALDIEAAAKRRLADEYDAAQDRGEVAKASDNLKKGAEIPEENFGKATVTDIGLTAKDIHEARQIRDAEKADPGVVRRTLDEKLDKGEEPTKAAVRKAVEAANQERKVAAAELQPQEASAHAGARVNVPAGMTAETMAREGMAMEANGQSADDVAKHFRVGLNSYRTICDIVFLSDRGGYSAKDAATVTRALAMVNDTQQVGISWDAVEPVATKVWGSDLGKRRPRADREPVRVDQFEHAFGVVMHTCATAAELDLPYLSAEDAKSAVKEINAARRNLQTLLSRIQELHND